MPATRAGDDEDDQPVAIGRKAQRLGALVVVADGDDGAAEVGSARSGAGPRASARSTASAT